MMRRKRHEEHDEEMPSRDTRYQRPSTSTIDRDQRPAETRDAGVAGVFFCFLKLIYAQTTNAL